MIDNNIVLGALIGLTVLYAYIKYNESKKPAPTNSYDKEINDILTKKEHKVKGRFD